MNKLIKISKDKGLLLQYFLLFVLSAFQSIKFLDVQDYQYLKVLTCINTFVFYVLLAQLNQKILKAVLLFSLFLTIFIYPTLEIYGVPDINLVASTFYTNTTESLSYIRLISGKIYIILLLVAVFTICLARFDYRKIEIPYLKIFLFFYLLSFFVYAFFTQDKLKAVGGYYSYVPIVKIPSYLAFEFYEVKKENNEIIKESREPSDWKIIDKDSLLLKNNFVIVIGESVRKDFLHAYGFPLTDTPFIDSSKHIQFNNYISVGDNTVSSLLRTIAFSDTLPNYQISDNIISFAKKVGYDTYWISNQGQIGKYDSPIVGIAKSSNHYTFLKKGTYAPNNSDTELLPIFYKSLQENKGAPKLIILHMIGSHPYACDHTGGKYDQFVLSENISCYIKSIQNTDTFLSYVYNTLVKTNKSFNLIYFSDHGLKINNDLTMSHNAYIKQSFEVPLLIWGNKINSQQKFDEIRNGKDFLYLFSELNGIKTKNIKRNYKFISDQKSNFQTTTVVDFQGKRLDYNNLEQNRIPDFKVRK